MFTFLLVVQTIIAASLVGTILMQRSEGGGLGVGGSSSGLMTARGASDFLTRTTAILGGMFVTLSIVLAAVAGVSREAVQIDTSLANQAAPSQQQLPPIQPGAPLIDPAAPANVQPATAQPTQPAQNESGGAPLAQ